MSMLVDATDARGGQAPRTSGWLNGVSSHKSRRVNAKIARNLDQEN